MRRYHIRPSHILQNLNSIILSKVKHIENKRAYIANFSVCPLCATIYSPVCGSDGNTYSSKCALDSKACREKIELTVSYSGKCDKSKF